MSVSTQALEDHHATSASQTRFFPLLKLPAELRHAVLRHCLVTESGMVEVVTNYLDCNPPAKIKFFTIRDLSILEANKQIRDEASELFYAENIFTLKSYPRTQEYGQKRFYGNPHYHLDYNRVRKTHILTPPGLLLGKQADRIRSMKRMRRYLEGIAEALAGNHSMRYMLVQAYDFEAIPFYQQAEWQLASILEPLENVRGLHLCHVHAMRVGLLPYLRFLERDMTKSFSESGNRSGTQRPLLSSALTCRGIMAATGITNDFVDPDLSTNKIFEILRAEPLYSDTRFLDDFEMDILSEDRL